MKEKTKKIIGLLCVIVLVMSMVGFIFLIVEEKNASFEQSAISQQPASGQNSAHEINTHIADPATQKQLEYLAKLRSEQDAAAPSPQVVQQQLDDLSKLRTQSAPAQAATPANPSQVQDQLSQLEALRKK